MLVSVCVTKGDVSMSETTKEALIKQLGAGTTFGDYFIVSLSLIKSLDLAGGYKEHDEMEVLSGTSNYEEKLCGLKFNVGPFAFF